MLALRAPDRAYPTLLALAAFDAAAYSLIAPVSPQIAQMTNAGPGVIGLLVGTFPLAMVLGFALSGPVIARGGGHRLMSVALVVVGCGATLFVVTDELATYFVGRALMGLGSGGLWVAVTFGTLERWPGQEYECMSRVLSAYAMGGLIGPALGAIGGVRGPFAGYLALTGVMLAAATLMPRAAITRGFRGDRSEVRSRGFAAASAAVLFVYLGYGLVEGILPLHLATGLDQQAIGAAFVMLSLVVGGGAAVAGRYPPRPVMLASLALVSAGIFAVGSAAIVGVWLVGLVVIGLGLGLGTTGSVGLLLDAVATDRIVTAMILWSQIGILGYLVGSTAGGGVAEAAGYGWLAVVPIAVAIIVLGLLRRPTRPHRSGTARSSTRR